MNTQDHPIMKQLNLLISKVDLLLSYQRNKNILGESHTPITNKEFMELFDISPGTATKWREKGLISFINAESKIYYKISDVKKFIENHYVKKN